MPRHKSSDQHIAPQGLSVYDRRVANPLGRRTRDIPLNADLRKSWTVRTFTQDVEHPDRHYQAVHELGYVPCTPADFDVDPASLGFTVNSHNHVVRGQHGQDIVMRIPAKEFKRIQKAKAEANLASVGKKKLKEEVAQATAKAHGDEAGETIHKTYEQTEIIAPVGVE